MALGIEYYYYGVMRAEEEREIWVKHYCSSHQILLVGEGDFSFSLSLARSFGSASNIVASSLDSYDELIKKYKQANSNVVQLVRLGTFPLHGVDANKMKLHPDLKMRKFDRIIFNFPHAGFHFRRKETDEFLIKKHREVVHGFFRNARGMLRASGEIHVSHKTTPPFSDWNLEELASQNSLALIECVDFKAEDYPGYNNKKGQGLKSDDPFPLGACSTYKFGFSPHTKKMPKVSSSFDTAHSPFQNFVETPVEIVRQPVAPYDFRQHQTNFALCPNNIPGYVLSQPTFTETFGRNDDVYNSVHKALDHGFATYMEEVPGRGLSGSIELLEELHRRCKSRLARLDRTLFSNRQW